MNSKQKFEVLTLDRNWIRIFMAKITVVSLKILTVVTMTLTPMELSEQTTNTKISFDFHS